METKGSNNGRTPKPQELQAQQDEWGRDLNPDHMAGQNIGPVSDPTRQEFVTAYDYKNLHRAFAALRDDELKMIPVLPIGSRLQQGSTYVDLAEGRPHEFRATGEVIADRGHFFVPKDEVPYDLWNRIIGDGQ